jgi:chromosome segregation ATPase
MDKATLDKEIKELEKKKEKLESEISQANMALNSTIDATTQAEKRLEDVKKQTSEQHLSIQKDTERLIVDVQSAHNDIESKKSEQDAYFASVEKQLADKQAENEEQTKLNMIAKAENDNKLLELSKKEQELESIAKKYDDIDAKIAHNDSLLKQIKKEEAEVKAKEADLLVIQKSIDQKIAENEDLLQKIIKNKADVESRQDELEQTYELNKTVLEDISAAQDELQAKEAALSQGEATLLKGNKELAMQKQMLEEKEYNLTILDLNLKDKQKKIVKQSKLYNLEK